MKILIVANNKRGRFSPFVVEQVEALRQLGVEIEYFGVSKKGIKYLMCLPALKRKIKSYKPDLVHAHFGLSGLLANLQRLVPVVTTFHGSDIHTGGWLLKLSKIAMKLSAYSIFASHYLYHSEFKCKNYIIQSCGLDMETIKPTDFKRAREYFGWDLDGKYVLFSSAFSNRIKNYPLAKAAVDKLDNVNLVELNGYTREEVSLLMNGCDCLLMTSFREAGPLVVKEAMACNKPIVTVDVGDAKWVVGDTEGCFISSYDVDECSEKVIKSIEYSKEYGHTNGRERIIELGLDNKNVAQVIKKVYDSVIR